MLLPYYLPLSFFCYIKLFNTQYHPRIVVAIHAWLVVGRNRKQTTLAEVLRRGMLLRKRVDKDFESQNTPTQSATSSSRLVKSGAMAA